MRLLLIEDVPADAELITYELRRANIAFEAKCVASKRAFLNELRTHSCDAIISDFSMPQFNALDALHALKAHRVEIPFILVTGSQSEEVAVECIKEGADDYILKSSLKRLPTALLSAIQKKKAEREREEAEQALRRSEEYFRSLIDSSSDIITIISPEGEIRFESPSLERTLGYAPNELIGESYFQFVHSADLSLVRDLFQRELKGRGGFKPIEYRFRQKNGGWRFLESVCRNMIHNPAVSGLVINSRDVAERKQAQERIFEQAALLNKAQDAIMVIDLNGQITFWNRSAEHLYRWKTEEVIGVRNAIDLHADVARHDEARQRTLSEGDWLGEMKQITRDNKELLVESRWTLVRDQDNQPRSILIINTDMTERKRLEAHFLRAQRMESIGTLAGGIAHDLNNVLTPILMSLKLLRDMKERAPEDLFETLETSAHRGAAIVQQVLSFARGVEGERSILQLKHPLNEVLKIAKDLFPPAIQVRSQIAADLWTVNGDPTQLHQVFMNLFVNARDAMPSGGRLQLSAQNVELDENYARMQPESKPGKYVLVDVSDTGSGIPPDLLNKVFEPFFTTKEVGKGTGLGLSTAIGIIRSHGGFMTVYSEPGKGSTFKVYLPAATSAKVERQAQKNQELFTGSGEFILVIDDEAAVREIIKVTLEANGYRVVTATDGAEAVGVFASKSKKFKAVIVDMMMPFMDGPSTIRAIQHLDPSMKFLTISGLMDQTRTAQLAELGNVSFLAKPFTTEQILKSLHELLKAPAQPISSTAP